MRTIQEILEIPLLILYINLIILRHFSLFVHKVFFLQASPIERIISEEKKTKRKKREENHTHFDENIVSIDSHAHEI